MLVECTPGTYGPFKDSAVPLSRSSDTMPVSVHVHDCAQHRINDWKSTAGMPIGCSIRDTITITTLACTVSALERIQRQTLAPFLSYDMMMITRHAQEIQRKASSCRAACDDCMLQNIKISYCIDCSALLRLLCAPQPSAFPGCILRSLLKPAMKSLSGHLTTTGLLKSLWARKVLFCPSPCPYSMLCRVQK